MSSISGFRCSRLNLLAFCSRPLPAQLTDVLSPSLSFSLWIACNDNEYDCEDATCISIDLRCNGRVNCRFRWDEDECQVSMVRRN